MSALDIFSHRIIRLILYMSDTDMSREVMPRTHIVKIEWSEKIFTNCNHDSVRLKRMSLTEFAHQQAVVRCVEVHA